MKKYGIGILTGIILGVSSMMFLGASSGVACLLYTSDAADE